MYACKSTGLKITEVETVLGSLYEEIEECYCEDQAEIEKEANDKKWFYETFFKMIMMNDFFFTATLNGHGPYSPMKTDFLGYKYKLYPERTYETIEDLESKLDRIFNRKGLNNG